MLCNERFLNMGFKCVKDTEIIPSLLGELMLLVLMFVSSVFSIYILVAFARRNEMHLGTEKISRHE